MIKKVAPTRPDPGRFANIAPLRTSTTLLILGLVTLELAINIAFGLGLLRERQQTQIQALAKLTNDNRALENDIATRLSVVDLSLQAAVRTLYKADANGEPRTETRVDSRGDGPSGSRGERFERGELTRAAAIGAAASKLLLVFQRGDAIRHATALMVADADGNLVLDSSAMPRQGNISKSDFFLVQKAKPVTVPGDDRDATQPFYVSRVVTSQQDGQYYLCISRRLSTADGHFAGVVFASVPKAIFDRAFADLSLGKQGAASLMRDDGTVLTRRPDRPQQINANLSNSEVMRQLPWQRSGHFEATSALDQIARLYVYMPIRDTPLFLTVGESLDEVYAGWWERVRLVGFLDIAVTLCVFGLGITLRRVFEHGRLGRLAAIRNESLFRGALNGSAIGTALFELDRHVSYVNPALAAFLDVAPAELIGDRLHDLLGATYWQEDQAGLAGLESGAQSVYVAERAFERPGSSVRHGLISITLVRTERGNPRFFIVQLQDITQRVRAEQSLSEQNEHLRVTLRSIADGVITTDDQGFVQFVNPAAEAICGWTQDAALLQPIAAIFSLRDPDTGLPVKDAVRRALAAPRATHISIGGVLIDRGGWRREVACNASPVRTADGAVIGAVLVVRDVSESRELHRKLAYNASHDALTGLPNRTAFGDALEHALTDAKQNGSHHALAFIDLDQFKIVNDTAGHLAGDMLLKQIALLVPSQLRQQDTVGRLGGDELGVILRHCSIEDAMTLMERLIQAINAFQFIWESRAYTVGASVGLTAVTASAVSPNALLTEADVACYAAKNNGRNIVSVYSGEQSEAADWHRKIVLAAGITEAISEGRLFLYAQKVLPNDEKEPARFELLARMFDREGVPIPTSVFIPAAERYDLMGHIDRWALEHALIELKRALLAGVLCPVHVNMSANSLNDPEFVSDALKMIRDSNVPASALTFEITETALMRNLASASVAISALRAAGVQVALDDFGIGMSSFGYLRNFPVDIVKIDGGFVVNMIENPVDRNIVKSIHQITRDLGARTVAEYVENDATLALLRQMGVDFFQGFHIHSPEPLRKVLDAEIMRARSLSAVA